MVLKKTIDNLISNAIKYNSKDNPLLKLLLKILFYLFIIMVKKLIQKNLFIVFEKYFQENPSNDGFGLGLAMVKEFCDKNKITINIETLEFGNKFNLNLKNIII